MGQVPLSDYIKLKWTLTLNTDALTVWSADTGEYECHGKGRRYGGGIRRDWTLVFKGKTIGGDQSRLSIAKETAQWHLNARQGFKP